MTIKRSTSVGGIVMNGDDVVLVKQLAGTWSLPKGHVEAGESEIDTARREIYEESGISELSLVSRIGSYERHPLTSHGEDTSVIKTIIVYLFTTSQRTLLPIDSDNPEAIWLPKHLVPQQLSHTRDRQFFQEFLNGLRDN